MKKRTLILALLYGSIALSAMSASFSIAWYASSARLRIETLEVKIDADRELQISRSEDRSSFVSDLHTSDFDAVGVFTPVTSAFSSSWEDHPVYYDMSRSMINFHGEPYLYPASYGYFCQEIYLMCDDDAYVGLDPKASYVRSNVAQNKAYAKTLANLEGDYSEEEYLSRLNRVVDSCRLGFFGADGYTIVDPFKEKLTVYAGALDNDKDGYYDYFQGSDGEYYEVAYGEIGQRGNLVYDAPLNEDSAAPAEFTAFDAKHKAGVHRLNLDESSEAEVAVEPSVSMHSLDVETPSFQLKLDAYKPYRLVVSFFLEGWDEDSVNGSMGSSFDLALSFKIIRER